MAALDFPASPTLNQVYSANGRSWIWDGTAWNPYGSGIADGGRGDITVSAGGSQWTIDPETVTYAKMQNVSAASRLLGRGSASGAGDVEEISLGTGLSMTGTTLSATGGGTGDVVGPASATDNALARYDLTTGKLIQNSGVTISDTNDVAGVDSLGFDVAAAVTLANQGQMAWNATEETVDVLLNGFTMHTGQHTLYHAKNQTVSTIAEGAPVMYDGTDGASGKLLIKPWDGVGPSRLFMGLTGEQLTSGQEGITVAFGKIRGIQTNGANYGETWADGDEIFVGTTSGSLTNVQPVAPNPHVSVGFVVNAHASNGTFFVRVVRGSNIADDEGVTITGLASGQLLVANAAGTVFENKSVSGDATLANTGALTIANGAVTNAKAADMAAWTVKARNNAASGDPQDVVATDLTEETTPAAGDFLLGWESGGALRKFDVGDLPGGGGSAPTFAEVASDVAITDNAAFQDITGLSFSVAANTTYRIDFVLAVTTNTGTTGYELGINGPASPTRIFSSVDIFTAVNVFNNTLTNGTSYGSIASNLNGPSTTPRTCRGTIYFQNGANAGTLQLQGKVETSVSGTVTFQANSSATITELA